MLAKEPGSAPGIGACDCLAGDGTSD